MNQKIIIHGYYLAIQKQIPEETAGKKAAAWEKYTGRKVQGVLKQQAAQFICIIWNLYKKRGK